MCIRDRIHRAIEAGDAQTGVVIMQMDAGLDTGDMLLTDVLDIAADDTTATLHDRLADMGGTLVVRALADAQTGKLQPVKQPEAGVTYAHKIEKAEATVNWQDSADTIGRRVRAFNPFPAASAQLGAEAAGNGLNARMRRPMVSALSCQCTVASAFSIL